MKWTREEHNHLVELREQRKSWQEIAERMTKKFGKVFSGEQCRARWRRKNTKIDNEPITEYKTQIEIQADGSHKSDRLLRMSAEQSKDPNYLLDAHGYDKNEWDLVSARNNIWNTYSQKDGIQTLYSSKITVKPKTSGIDFEKLLETIKNVPKVIIKPKYITSNDKKYLLLPMYDMHFGISTYDHYRGTQAKILELLKNGYKEVLIIFGQDAFHNDDFRGRTSSGREIQKVDMVQAWRDATSFFEPIITEALSRNSKVNIMYSKGNHSETIEWTYVQYLKARFPQCQFDDSLKERKVHMLGLNLCGANHGDKKNEKNLPENFATEFPAEWSKATTRTVFTGHRHSEMVIDVGGVLVRRMPTRNETDEWHDDQGYTTAHKRFQIHEFNQTEQIGMYYV